MTKKATTLMVILALLIGIYIGSVGYLEAVIRSNLG